MKHTFSLLVALLLLIAVFPSTPAMAACSHSMTTTETELAFQDNVDENYHYTHYSVYKVCTLCGERIEKIEGGYKGFPHSYDSDGVCADCGHRTCTHWWQTTTNEWYTYEQIPENSTMHMTTLYQDWSCKLCEEPLVYGKEYSKEEQAHSFNSSGKCTQCGYVKTCTHNRQDITNSRFEYEQISGNSSQHLVICYNTWSCLDCGKVTLYDERWYSEEQNHSFSNNKCTLCGYRIDLVCKHTNTITEKRRTEYEKLEGNDNQHRVINYIKTTCDDCGYVVSADEVQYQVAAHSYDTSNKCTVCGYQKATVCQHNNTKTETSSTKYEKLDGNDRQHQVIYHKKTTCVDCNKVITEDEVEHLVGGHSFDNNGRCMSCGYEKVTCDHSSTYKKYVTDAEYTNYDEEQHNKTRYYNLLCSKCSKVLEENVENEEVEKHSLDGQGACYRCDYRDIAKCKHWNTTKAIVERQSYRNLNTTEHRAYGFGTETCKDCGVVVEENTEVDVEEYHTFDLEGICIYCGKQIGIYTEDEDIPGLGGAQKFPKEGGTDDRRPKGGWLFFDWTVSTNVDWITLHSSGGTPGDSYTFTVAENMGEDRTGYIIVDDGYGVKMYVVIIQEGVTEVKAEIPPTLSGFSVTPNTVTLGDSITVTGTINGNGAKLTAVSVAVRNYSDQSLGGYWGHQTTLNDDSFDLSSFGPIVLSGDLGNTDFKTGEWIVQVYATTEDGLGFEREYSQIITINKPVCKHENAQPVATGEVVYYNQTETHHDAQYGYTLVCPTCNEPVDTGYSEAAPEVHDFNQGNTCVCGYEKPVCQHLVKDAEYISTVSLTDNGDGATHTHVYNAHLTCKNCDEYLSKGKATEDKEAHRLNDQYTYGKDDNGHWKIWKNVCGCGYVAKVTDESEQGEVEAHTPDENGECTVCGVAQEVAEETVEYRISYRLGTGTEQKNAGATITVTSGAVSTITIWAEKYVDGQFAEWIQPNVNPKYSFAVSGDKNVISLGGNDFSGTITGMGSATVTLWDNEQNVAVGSVTIRVESAKMESLPDETSVHHYKINKIEIVKGKEHNGKKQYYSLVIDISQTGSASVQCEIIDTTTGKAFYPSDENLPQSFEIKVDGKKSRAPHKLSIGEHRIELYVDGTVVDSRSVYCMDGDDWEFTYRELEAEYIYRTQYDWRVKFNRVEVETLLDKKFDECSFAVYADDGNYLAVWDETLQEVIQKPTREGWDSIDLRHNGISAKELDDIAVFDFPPKNIWVFCVSPWGEYYLVNAYGMGDSTYIPTGLLERFVYNTIDTALDIGGGMSAASERYQEDGNVLRLWADSLVLSYDMITGMNPIDIASEEIANTIYQDVFGFTETDQAKVQALKTLVTDIMNMDSSDIKDTLRLEPLKDYSDRSEDYIPSFDEGFSAQLTLTKEIVDLYGLEEFLTAYGLDENKIAKGAYSLVLDFGTNIPKQDVFEETAETVFSWAIEEGFFTEE